MDQRLLGSAFLVLLLVVVGLGCNPDKGSYVRANERILAGLPQIPGSQELRHASTPYYDPEREMFSRIIGYGTNVVYEIPAAMTQQDVTGFYTKELGTEWQHTVEEIPVVRGSEQTGSVFSVHFVRDKATVTVMTDGLLNGGHTIEVAIDHKGNRG